MYPSGEGEPRTDDRASDAVEKGEELAGETKDQLSYIYTKAVSGGPEYQANADLLDKILLHLENHYDADEDEWDDILEGLRTDLSGLEDHPDDVLALLEVAEKRAMNIK